MDLHPTSEDFLAHLLRRKHSYIFWPNKNYLKSIHLPEDDDLIEKERSLRNFVRIILPSHYHHHRPLKANLALEDYLSSIHLLEDRRTNT